MLYCTVPSLITPQTESYKLNTQRLAPLTDTTFVQLVPVRSFKHFQTWVLSLCSMLNQLQLNHAQIHDPNSLLNVESSITCNSAEQQECVGMRYYNRKHAVTKFCLAQRLVIHKKGLGVRQLIFHNRPLCSMVTCYNGKTHMSDPTSRHVVVMLNFTTWRLTLSRLLPTDVFGIRHWSHNC